MDKPKGISQALNQKNAPVRGAGDVVARVTSALGIKPCQSCEERRKALNKLMPFGTESDKKID
jgi:hypothetical protein